MTVIDDRKVVTVTISGNADELGDRAELQIASRSFFLQRHGVDTLCGIVETRSNPVAQRRLGDSARARDGSPGSLIQSPDVVDLTVAFVVVRLPHFENRLSLGEYS